MRDLWETRKNSFFHVALKHKRMIWVLFGELYWSTGFWSSQSAWLNSFSDRNLLYFPSFCCFGSLPVNFQTIVSDKKLVIHVGFLFYEPNHIFCDWNSLIMTTHRLLNCLLVGCFQKEWNKNKTPSVAAVLYVLHSDKDAKLHLSNLSFFLLFSPGTTCQNGTTGGHQSHGRHRGQ